MIAAPMSTSLFEFMYFGYGNPIIRLLAVTVVISSGDFASRIQAYSLPAATWLRSDHSAPRCCWCSSTVRPAAARRAVSNIGYTCTGM